MKRWLVVIVLVLLPTIPVRPASAATFYYLVRVEGPVVTMLGAYGSRDSCLAALASQPNKAGLTCRAEATPPPALVGPPSTPRPTPTRVGPPSTPRPTPTPTPLTLYILEARKSHPLERLTIVVGVYTSRDACMEGRDEARLKAPWNSMEGHPSRWWWLECREQRGGWRPPR